MRRNEQRVIVQPWRAPSESSRRWSSPISPAQRSWPLAWTPRTCARLEPFFELAREALTGHGGTIEKYIGDAVMAVFGVPCAHGDDPDRAVAAGLALARQVTERGDGLAVRIGIETGEVLATKRGGDLAVTGDAVNAAARLQRQRSAARCWSASGPRDPTRLARLERRGPIDARGFPAPLQAWRALEMATEGG